MDFDVEFGVKNKGEPRSSSAARTAPLELRDFIERILDFKTQQDHLAGEIRQVYSEAKTVGLDKQAMGQLVTYLRKREKDSEKLEEQSAVFELYRAAYEGFAHAHAHAREAGTAGPAHATGRPQVQSAGSVDCPETEMGAITDHPGQAESDTSGLLPAEGELKPGRYALRPQCKRPDNCAGYGSTHCHSCLMSDSAEADSAAGISQDQD